MRRDDATKEAATRGSNGANPDDSTADGRVDDAIELVVDEVSDAVAEPGWRGLPHRIRATPGGRLALKIVIGVVGTLVLVLGLFLIPFPGPGWLVVLAGLAILASEFDWARRLLHFTRGKLEAWWHWIGRQTPLVRLLIGLVGFVFVAFVVWASVRLSFDFDIARWLLDQV